MIIDECVRGHELSIWALARYRMGEHDVIKKKKKKKKKNLSGMRENNLDME